MFKTLFYIKERASFHQSLWRLKPKKVPSEKDIKLHPGVIR